MIYLKLLIYFLSIFIPGYFILLFWKKEMPFLFRLALAYGLGNFIIGVQMFLYHFILQAHTNFILLCSIFLVEDILLFYFAYKRGLFNGYKFKWPKNLKTGEIVLVLLLAIQLTFLFFNVVSRPTINFDSLAMWSFKAKNLYYEKGIDFNPDSAVYLGGGGHINYPWLIPLSQFWLHEILGEYNDLITNFVFFFYFVFIIILFYYFIRKYASRFASLLFAFIFSTMPLIFYHSYNGYADLPLGYYNLVAFVLLFFWIESRKKKDLILSAIFFGIASWVKMEALFFIVSALLIFSYYLFSNRTAESQLKKILKFLLGVLIVIWPILFFNFKYRLGISNVEPGMGFHPEIFKNLFESLFISGNWNIWWFIVLMIFIINIKDIFTDKKLLFGWLYLFIVLGEFMAVYLFTNDYQYAVNQTAISRNIITLLPITVFLVGITCFSDLKLDNQ